MRPFLTLYNIMLDEVVENPNPRGDLVESAIVEARPLLEITRPFGIFCDFRDFMCASNLLVVLVARIDQQVAAQPIRAQAAQAIASYRANLVALGCDQASTRPGASIAGTWTSVRGLTYQITQSGSTIGWQVASISETAVGTINGTTVTASWNGNWGPGSASGTVSFGPNGVANRITWNNGAVFMR